MPSAVLEGQPFDISVTKQRWYLRGSTDSVKISVAWPSEGRLALIRKTAFDRWANEIGLAKPHLTGDADFDDLVYFATEDEAVAATFGGSPRERAAITRIFAEGASNLVAGGNALQAFFAGRTVELDAETNLPVDDGDRRWVTDIVQQLREIVRSKPIGLPKASGLQSTQLMRSLIPIALLTGAAYMLSSPAQNHVIDPADLDRLMYRGWIGAGAVSIVFLIGMAAAFWGRAMVHRALASATALLAAITFFTGDAVGPIANEIFDSGPTSTVIVPIIETFTRHHNKSTHDYATYRLPWRSENSALLIGSDEYDAVQPGRDCLLLQLAPGLFAVRHIGHYAVGHCPSGIGDVSPGT